MVEESNAASHTLVTEVSSLSGRLSQFNLGSAVKIARTATHAAAGPTAATVSPQPVARAAARPATRTPVAAAPTARPAPSPARALGNKVAAAFNAAPVPASSGGDWEEF
jgi:methyl-accepting chemotaxis protein/methyl-accepting chemotaxis protein-1 (serine sensor receptor)